MNHIHIDRQPSVSRNQMKLAVLELLERNPGRTKPELSDMLHIEDREYVVSVMRGLLRSKKVYFRRVVRYNRKGIVRPYGYFVRVNYDR